MEQFNIDVVTQTIAESKKIHNKRHRGFRPGAYFASVMTGESDIITHTLRNKVKNVSTENLALVLLKACAIDYALSSEEEREIIKKYNSVGYFLMKENKTEEDKNNFMEFYNFLVDEIDGYRNKRPKPSVENYRSFGEERYGSAGGFLEQGVHAWEEIYFNKEYKLDSGKTITGDDILFNPEINKMISEKVDPIIYSIGNEQINSVEQTRVLR